MLDTSTVGRGQVKARSLDVEANLLAERSSEKSRLNERIRRKTLALGLTCLAAVCAAPPLYGWSQKSSRALADAQAKLAKTQAELKGLQDLQNRTAPTVQRNELSEKVVRRAQLYTGQLYEFFGASRPDMVLDSVKVELIAGELRISARGNAEDYEAYQGYVGRLQKTFGAQNVAPRSARSSPDLGENGIIFELIQKVSVSQP